MMLQNTRQGSEGGRGQVRGEESPKQPGSVEGLQQWEVVGGVSENRKWG